MKIVIDISPLKQENISGVGKYLQEILSSLLILDKDNQYFLFSYGQKNKDVKVDLPHHQNIHYIHLPIPTKLVFVLSFLNLFFLDSLKIAKEKIRADIVWMPNLGICNLKFKSTKLITTIHDLSFKIYPEFFNLKRRLWHALVQPKKIIQRSDKILAVSENTSLDLQKIYQVSADKIKVMNLGVSKKYRVLEKSSLESIRSKYNLNKNFILFLGTREPRKNILSLLKSFSQLNLNDIELVIAGGQGWKEKIWKDYYNNLDQEIKCRIKILNFVAEEDLPALYNLAQVFVWPSFYEGFGLPVLEAMACGCPVITSNNSSLPEVVQNNALLIEAFNIQDLTQALDQLLSDQELYNFYQNKEFNHNFYDNWEKATQKLLNIFKNI
jgi:glycosyltransferase involved in cell wall biosynthesis